MSDSLVADDFRGLTEPLVVEAQVGGAPVAASLSVESVDALPAHRLRAEPFSLVLRGPREPALPQATYALRHPRLGTIELFLVPIGQDAQGLRYEALFN
jgi:hypothetical protein